MVTSSSSLFPNKKGILILFNSCTTVAASASAVTLILSPDFYDIRIQPTVPSSSSPFATAAYSSSSFALAATFGATAQEDPVLDFIRV